MDVENVLENQRGNPETTLNNSALKNLVSYLSKCEYGVDIKRLNDLILDSLYSDPTSCDNRIQKEIQNQLKKTFALSETAATDFVNLSSSLCGNNVRPLDVLCKQATLIARSSDHYIEARQYSHNSIRGFHFDKDGSAPEGSFVDFQNSSMSENMEKVSKAASTLNQDRTKNASAIQVLNYAIGRLFQNSYQPYEMTLQNATYSLLEGIGFKLSEEEATDHVVRAQVIHQSISVEANCSSRLAQIGLIRKHPEVFGAGTYKTVINDIISDINKGKSTFLQWCPERDRLDRLRNEAVELRDK